MRLAKNIKTLILIGILSTTTLLGLVTINSQHVSAAVSSCGELTLEDVRNQCLSRIDACNNLGGEDKEACVQAVHNSYNPSSFQSDCNDENVTTENCGIVRYLKTFINVLSGVVGLVIVIVIAIAGIQYTTSRDDPQAVKSAKNRLFNAILALVVYLFAFAFLQWLVPGGIF